MEYNNHSNSSHDPWEETYQTGPTRPPKSNRGLVAFLLVVVILLGGLSSVLGVLNVRLAGQLGKAEPEADATLSFSPASETWETEQALAAEDPTEATTGVEIVTSPTSVPNYPQQEGLSLQEIYRNTIDSVVSITSNFSNGYSTGTGVVLTADGYLVTNCHVVEGASTIYVRFTDERVMPAKLVGTDATTDLAVLQVEADDLIPAEFGDSSMLQVGDAVAAIGDPLGVELRGTMTNGIVSAINRDISSGGRTMTLIQTNAALNSGNSGGPLLNCYGQVVGINTMKMGDNMDVAGVEGLGFAIPSTTVKEIVDQLIDQGYVLGRPWLGISGQEVPFFYQLYKQLPQGLYITEVDASSDAAAKGISPGDILLALDGNRITDADSLTTVMYGYQAGDMVTVIVYRSGRQYELQLRVGQAN